MFDALASPRLSAGASRSCSAAVVFFGAAGAVGGSVADRLDPYGADDPDTESVIAAERLEDAGYRDAGGRRPDRGRAARLSRRPARASTELAARARWPTPRSRA